jgi:acyl carrier protein
LVTEATTLKIIKKRREEVRKIVCAQSGEDRSADEEIRSQMKDMGHLTSLTSLVLNFYL